MSTTHVDYHGKGREKFELTPDRVWNLAYECEFTQIVPCLKDPDSFRRLGHKHQEVNGMVFVQFDYTAINEFRGRVKGRKILQLHALTPDETFNPSVMEQFFVEWPSPHSATTMLTRSIFETD